MHMQLRMMEIRNKIEMLENPVMRKTYEDVHFNTNNNVKSNDHKLNVFVVTKDDTIAKTVEYLNAAKIAIGADEIVKLMPSLKVCMEYFNWKYSSKHFSRK